MSKNISGYFPFNSPPFFYDMNIVQATDSMGSITGDNRTGAPRVRRYHLLPLPGTKRGIRIFLDRLQLLNILDQVYYSFSSSVADPGSGALLTPGSGIRDG
jgi:hypothetical protein